MPENPIGKKMKPEFKFDPSNYPRTYASSTEGKIWMSLGGGILCAGGLAVLLYIGVHAHEEPNASILFVRAAIMLLPTLLGAYSVMSIVRHKIVLTNNAIEQYGGLKIEKMRRDSIAGYILKKVKGIDVLELTPNQEEMKKMKVYLPFNRDHEFNTWLEGLQNLDQNGNSKLVKEIAQYRTPVTSPEVLETQNPEEAKVISGYKRFGTAILILAIVGFIADSFFSRYTTLDNGLMKTSAGLGISFAVSVLIIVGVILKSRGVQVFWNKMYFICFAYMLLFTAVMFSTFADLANKLMLTGNPEEHFTQIIRKSKTSDKYSYHCSVLLADWRNGSGEISMPVSVEYYFVFREGAKVRVVTRKSLWGIEYIDLATYGL
jgi:hypothetical protein